MRNHRMFSTKLITDDRFTALTPLMQILYIRLIAVADDEGFVSNLRMLVPRRSALTPLVSAGLLHIFDTGPALILHWYAHNAVKNTHMKQTLYQAEKALVILDENKIYRLKNEEEKSGILPPKEKERKEKKSKVKEREEQGASAPTAGADSSLSDKESDFNLFWNAYPNKSDRTGALAAFREIDTPVETLLAAIDKQKQQPSWVNDGGAFIPRPENWLKKRRWEDEITATVKHIPKGASGVLGTEELAAIRRALQEKE